MQAGRKIDEMGAGNLGKSGVRGHRRERNSIPFQDFLEIQAIDSTQGVELVDVGKQSLVFDFGKTVDQNQELVVMVLIGDFLAGQFNVPDAEGQPFSNSS